MTADQLYMQRAIDLARLGSGKVAPNPMVGAVIVLNDRILGEGYHKVFGESHAEVNAIEQVKDKTQLKEATIYVTLEPCAHQGKTPPCADLLVRHQMKRAVIGCLDPFSKVNGKGVEILQKAGIQVETGVLEKECRELNKRFFTFHERQRPYVILKWAQTKDGFLDKTRVENETGINWITTPETKVLVHKWRSEEQSILVGRKTVQNDDPSLTVRELSGNNPIRVIIDSQLKLSPDLNVFSDDAPTLIFNRVKNEVKGNNEWIKISETNTELILNELYKRNIQSVFVEGGSRTLQYFIFGNVWDEARVIIGDIHFGSGKRAPIISKAPSETFPFGKDQVYIYYRK
jgi:diaminohydroxyphosphoribosylaminopyrimidine deaminase/5-amino-6-(5-phosphoribosylamino)uracil reductase